MDWWLEKGGDAALVSYGGEPSDVPSSYIEWLDKLPLIHADRHRLYVHAGIDPDVTIDRQTEKTLLWTRYPDQMERGFGHHHVVHGHDSFPDGPKLYEGMTNLKTRAWWTGRAYGGKLSASDWRIHAAQLGAMVRKRGLDPTGLFLDGF